MTRALEPHSKLPSERLLCDELGVSRLTVRRALTDLANDGVIYRIQGAGTFVAEPTLHLTQELRSFSESMRARGLEPSTEVLQLDEAAATVNQAWRLTRSPGEPLYRIARLRRGGDMAMCLEEAFVVQSVAPGLLDHDLTGSLYEILTTQYGIVIASAVQTLTATVLDEREAELLAVAPQSPAMRILRVAMDQDGNSVELASSLYRGDQYSFEHTLARR